MKAIWVEKYRPIVLEDVEGNPGVMQQLIAFGLEGNVPHLLLAGPPGTGKTTSINCLARKVLGVERMSKAVLELNASDERGIDVVRDRIKSFAKEAVNLPKGRHKIVILDEVDSMTEGAQQALRRLMELHSDTTRFALACNQSTKIIEPIQSRCGILRFGRLKDEEILKRLLHICKEENIEYVDSGLEALIFTAEGDMRNAINNLQSTVTGFGLVSGDNVMKVCDFPPPERIKDIIAGCLEVNWSKAHIVAQELVEIKGYSALDIVGVMKGILQKMEMKEHLALEFYKELAKTHHHILEGCASMLQIDRLLCNLCRICVTTQAT